MYHARLGQYPWSDWSVAYAPPAPAEPTTAPPVTLGLEYEAAAVPLVLVAAVLLFFLGRRPR